MQKVKVNKSQIKLSFENYVSEGNAPNPRLDSKAEYGPLASNVKYNAICPLNAKTGAPGTTGCYSNCERKFVKGNPPSEFEEFKSMSSFKKILSIGGWEYPAVPTGEAIPLGEKNDAKNYLVCQKVKE
ncbi:hypothetical protein CONCODRAFT_3940 [Conidiobolus coronatus NRRL 28638]|uniref:Uncharacterized protein n=1 Tax=Conidiobolus coronatus (strain ATCC 28846 / CBS 209.66 / NRRL 28638) TaxID=796925 RepID=A0A137PE25_CONC2|nr:hypothetical protein CONCODRAFT_3940 [Conidiobolus coronatus NRRL 28638]|eukprot:KXN73259.1 hypothetical protein CONCODRAFT_3940 [Conidiobolus coronatus NRRL 28638]